MDEPITECTWCDATLDRCEQGIFKMCYRCRKLWDIGFQAGFANAGRLKEAETGEEVDGIHRSTAPYYIG